jgi:hypothetical protein
MTLKKTALLLGGVGLMLALGTADAEANRRPFFRSIQPYGWQWRAPAPQYYYHQPYQYRYSYDPARGTYRRFSVEPGAEAVPAPTVTPAPTATPAPAFTPAPAAPSRTPSAGDTVRRRLRPGS